MKKIEQEIQDIYDRCNAACDEIDETLTQLERQAVIDAEEVAAMTFDDCD